MAQLPKLSGFMEAWRRHLITSSFGAGIAISNSILRRPVTGEIGCASERRFGRCSRSRSNRDSNPASAMLAGDRRSRPVDRHPGGEHIEPGPPVRLPPPPYEPIGEPNSRFRNLNSRRSFLRQPGDTPTVRIRPDLAEHTSIWHRSSRKYQAGMRKLWLSSELLRLRPDFAPARQSIERLRGSTK